MPQLTIRVGASVDRSLAVAYRSFVEAGERARRATEESGKRGAAGFSGAMKKGTDQAEKNYRKMVSELEKENRKIARDADKAAKAQTTATEREARAQVRIIEKAAKDKVRAEKAAAREIEKDRRHTDRAIITGARLGRGAFDKGSRAAGNAFSTVTRSALGIAGSVARGAGVNFDLGSHIKSGVELESKAVDLSNSGYMPGKAGAAGVRQDSKAIEREARAVGDFAGYDPNQAIGGLQKFVAKTGDLQSGRDILKDMAKYARASGADLEDMVDAAGDVSNALGDTDNKGEKIKNVMRAIAAQGKEGAVEIKDLATQMAKLAAASSQFTGDPSQVMAQMGALTQMTRAKGGASSATQAATSVSSFTNTFSKGARLDAFKHYGVDIRGEGGKVDVKKAIFGAIKAASSTQHGGMAQFDKNMGKMFMDVRARSVTRGFETIFKEGGGGEAGLKKAMEAFDGLAAATMREQEITESFNRAMNTTEAKVQRFNNELSASATALKEGLEPAAKALAPLLVSLAKASADAIAQYTGTAEREKQRADVGVETSAINITSSLRRGQEKGVVSEAETQAAVKAKAALEGSILQKQQQVEKRREGLKAAGRLFGDDFDKVGEDAGLRKLAEGDGGVSEEASQQIADKQQLGRMREELEDLTREINSVNDKYMNGMLRVLEAASNGNALRVEVTNNQPLDPGPGGRRPPPGHQEAYR